MVWKWNVYHRLIFEYLSPNWCCYCRRFGQTGGSYSLVVGGLRFTPPTHFHPFPCFLIHLDRNRVPPPVISHFCSHAFPAIIDCISWTYGPAYIFPHLNSHKPDILLDERKGFRSHTNNHSFWSTRRNPYLICKIINFSDMNSNYCVYSTTVHLEQAVWCFCCFVFYLKPNHYHIIS